MIMMGFVALNPSYRPYFHRDFLGTRLRLK